MILDTNAISDLFTGNAELSNILASSVRHHLPVVVLGEYRYGLIGSLQKENLEALLARLEEESIVLSPDSRTASYYALIRHELKEKGRPIPENDIWISALCRQHELEIVSRDTHFDFVDGISRIDW